MTLSTYAGGAIYSNSEYDKFTTGSAVRETVVRLWDWSLLRYRLARAYVVDLGRPDTVTPVDGDAAIQYEPLPSNRKPGVKPTAMQLSAQNATHRAQQYTDKQRAERINAIMELLQSGPCSTATAARHIGVTPRTVKALLPFAHNIRSFGRRGDGVWIGLAGQALPDRKRPPLSGNALACYIHIKTHGPSTATEMKLALNVGYEVLKSAMRFRSDVFVVVESEQTGKYKSKSVKWGLVADVP